MEKLGRIAGRLEHQAGGGRMIPEKPHQHPRLRVRHHICQRKQQTAESLAGRRYLESLPH